MLPIRQLNRPPPDMNAIIQTIILLALILTACALHPHAAQAAPPEIAFPATPDSPPPPGMANLAQVAPDIILDLKYAGPDNFLKRPIYPHASCYLRADAAERLAKVQADLAAQHLGLKVWDCFRPMSAQRDMWKAMPDPNFVANPGKGSRHSYGEAVDLTLVDATGHELPMPTAFDHFGREACSNYPNLPDDVIRNRELLQKAMRRHGFSTISTEWWHFNAPRRGQ